MDKTKLKTCLDDVYCELISNYKAAKDESQRALYFNLMRQSMAMTQTFYAMEDDNKFLKTCCILFKLNMGDRIEIEGADFNPHTIFSDGLHNSLGKVVTDDWLDQMIANEVVWHKIKYKVSNADILAVYGLFGLKCGNQIHITQADWNPYTLYADGLHNSENVVINRWLSWMLNEKVDWRKLEKDETEK